MTHPANETLVAFVDGELTPAACRQTERHLAECRDCSETLTELDQSGTLFAYALRWIDEVEPAEWRSGLAAVADIRARTDALGALPVPTPQAASSTAEHTPSRPRVWRWAAGLVLLSGAAAAAIAGPERLVGIFTANEPQPEAVQPAVGLESSGAIAVAPAQGSVDIVLGGVTQGTRVEVVFAERSDVIVDFMDGSTPGVVARDGHLTLQLSGAHTVLRVTVPANLPAARILVGAAEVAVMERGRITRVHSDRGIIIDSVVMER